MTFVEDFLATQGIRLKKTDNSLIFEQGKKIDLVLNKPSVLENIDLTKALFNRKERNIKFLSYDELRKWGWIIYQRPIKSATYNWSWYFPPHQRVYYFAYEIEKTPPSYSISAVGLPKDVYIRYDIRSRLFRLEGPNTGPSNIGKWKPIDKDRKRLNIIKARKTKMRRRGY